MARRFSTWLSCVAQLGRLLAVVLALASQISAGAVALPKGSSATPSTLLEAAMVLCVGGSHPGKDGLPPIHHHLFDPAIAAQGHHFVHNAAILENDKAVPPPPASLACWTGVPEARGPPARYAAAAYPTGPPPHLI
jgi:hypothetical protein